MVSELPDDVLLEIISRVPYRTICSCRCVSTRWRDLISHPDHRKKLPSSTLAGFFYQSGDRHHEYKSLTTGRSCPRFSLSFLPDYDSSEIDIHMLDGSNGLLLFRRRRHVYPRKIDYVVCNPATKRWVVVPATAWSNLEPIAFLGFDPAVSSSHFHVFELASADVVDGHGVDVDTQIEASGIYSSKAGTWMRRSAWDRRSIGIRKYSGSAFLNGVLYLSCYDDLVVAAIDVQGNCEIIPIPMPNDARVFPNVYESRGHLYLVNYGDSELTIWALEDSGAETWALKHNISLLQLFGTDYPSFQHDFSVISSHPECNVIVIDCAEYPGGLEQCTGLTSPRKLMSYDMDSRELQDICSCGFGYMSPRLSYVPLFSESLADRN